ncbi:trypsin-like serine protease [Streptomyces sp. NPDC058171]
MTHARFRRRRPGTARAAAIAALSISLLAGGSTLPASAAPGTPDATPPAPTTPVAVDRATDAELRERLAGAAGAEAEKAPADARARAAAPAPGADTGPSPFIVGGSETTISSAPWMVQLGYWDEAAGKGSFCGGTLVAPNKVLTAAHCVYGLDWRRNGVALVGATKLMDPNAGTAAGVHRVWRHAKYDHRTLRNDIAVITLDRPVKGKWLRPAASGDSSLYKTGTTGTVYGWGLTSGRSGAQQAKKLRKVSLPMVADSTCDRAMRGVLGRDFFVAGEMHCAGKPATGRDSGTKSSCHGDSGGPLVVGGKIAGVVSWGVKGCITKGAYPVFTKVRTYAGATQGRIDDADPSYDGRADLIARGSDNKLYQRNSKGRSLAARTVWGTDWNDLSWGLQSDFDRDGHLDLLIRDKNDGKLYRRYVRNATTSSAAWAWQTVTSVGGGSKSYAAPGDFTGDGWPDLITTDGSGNAYLYPGKGNGAFGSKKKVVNGAWKGAKLFGRGDLTNDGKADLLVRDKANTVWLYRGTGKASAPFAAKIKARTNWKFTALVGNGDLTGDGIADVLARDSGGKLWLYPGTGKASSSLFGTRVSLGSGFNQYNLLF